MSDDEERARLYQQFTQQDSNIRPPPKDSEAYRAGMYYGYTRTGQTQAGNPDFDNGVIDGERAASRASKINHWSDPQMK